MFGMKPFCLPEAHKQGCHDSQRFGSRSGLAGPDASSMTHLSSSVIRLTRS
jgi:hypothetical protein